MRKTLVYCIG